MAGMTEAERLRAEIAQAQRRRDSARKAAKLVRVEVDELKKLLETGPVPAADLEVGDRVRLAGLSEAPKLNGQMAEVIGKDPKKARFKVRLASGEIRQVPVASLEPLARGRAGFPKEGGRRSRGTAAPPLLSPLGLRMRSCLPEKVGGLPCELVPFAQSTVARVFIPEKVVERLRAQLDAAARHTGALDRSPQLLGEVRSGCQVTIEQVDREYECILFEMCNLLAFGTLGTTAFRCEVDATWGVVQREGDYVPVQSHRNGKAPTGFSSLLDLELPPSLSPENHDMPAKGSYGFHDGIHNIIWKSDRTTDQYDLVQPGIIQCELVTGCMYVYPQQLQSYTYPFSGPGDRKWVCSTVGLLDVAPEPF
mmetsp:Transcript_64577/g.192367  ORF Transcript_64577/g.192367 Transcript_64577/m.192367 type:complete len:365 (-) Transcript_64577:156-1250(-)